MTVRLAHGPRRPIARAPRPDRVQQWSTWCAALAAALATIGLTAMQAVPSVRGVRTGRVFLSAYALTSIGWIFDVSVALLAVCAGAVTSAMIAAGLMRPRSVPAAALGCTMVGLIAVVVFPQELGPTGALTPIGWVHAGSALLALTGPPVAAVALSWRHASRARHPGALLAALTLAVGVLAAAGTVTFTVMATAWPVLAGPHLLAVTEQGVVACEIAIALILTLWVSHTRGHGHHHRPYRARRPDGLRPCAAPPPRSSTTCPASPHGP